MWLWMTANNPGKPGGLWAFLGVEKGKHSLGPKESRGAYRATSSAWAAGGSGNQFSMGFFYWKTRCFMSFKKVSMDLGVTQSAPHSCTVLWQTACPHGTGGRWCWAPGSKAEMSEDIFFRGWNFSSLRMVSCQTEGEPWGFHREVSWLSYNNKKKR